MFEAIPFPEALASRANIGLREAIQFTRIYNVFKEVECDRHPLCQLLVLFSVPPAEHEVKIRTIRRNNSPNNIEDTRHGPEERSGTNIAKRENLLFQHR
jgi:hypothetical protein